MKFLYALFTVAALCFVSGCSHEEKANCCKDCPHCCEAGCKCAETGVCTCKDCKCPNCPGKVSK